MFTLWLVILFFYAIPFSLVAVLVTIEKGCTFRGLCLALGIAMMPILNVVVAVDLLLEFYDKK
jgi:hypothetical protein